MRFTFYNPITGGYEIREPADDGGVVSAEGVLLGPFRLDQQAPYDWLLCGCSDPPLAARLDREGSIVCPMCKDAKGPLVPCSCGALFSNVQSCPACKNQTTVRGHKCASLALRQVKITRDACPFCSSDHAAENPVPQPPQVSGSEAPVPEGTLLEPVKRDLVRLLQAVGVLVVLASFAALAGYMMSNQPRQESTGQATTVASPYPRLEGTYILYTRDLDNSISVATAEISNVSWDGTSGTAQLRVLDGSAAGRLQGRLSKKGRKGVELCLDRGGCGAAEHRNGNLRFVSSERRESGPSWKLERIQTTTE